MKPACYLTMLLALGVHDAARAAEPLAPAKSAAYQGGISQDQLRVASQRLRDEISQLADAYSKYPGAAGDVAILRKTVADMEKLSSKDMVSVSKVLMDASRSMDAKVVQGNLNEANGAQKQIQIVLREMADKLARQSDLATMQKRLEDLAIRQHANLEATRDFAAMAPNFQKLPARHRDSHRAKKDEQTALAKEAGLAVQMLEKLAAESTAESGSFLKEAAATARNRKLVENAEHATLSLELDYAEAGKDEQEVLDILKAMIAGLDAGKTPEQRTRELASELEELARQQKALSQQTPKMNGNEQDEAAKKQEEIAGKLDVMEDRLAKDEPEAATKTQEAAKESTEAAKELADDRNHREPGRVEKTSEKQGKVADDLAKLADELEKKAEAMAGTDPQDSEPMDPKEAAMQEAMDQMQEAKTDLEIAKLQEERKQDSTAKANSAMEKMGQAEEQMKKAGQGESPASENLESAEKHAQQAAKGEGVGQNLSQSAGKLAQAMNSLQNTMNQGTPSNKRGNGPGEGGMGGGGANGNLTKTDARGKGGESQRDALSLQQQDKVAPAYESAVNQYLKNLAEDTGSEP